MMVFVQKQKGKKMDDTISRQAAIDAIFSEPLYKSGMKKRDADVVVPAIYEKIKSLPSAQPERKKGRWIVIVKGCKLTSYKCSECGRYIADDTGYDVKKDYPFCHCGADMREDTDE